MLSQIIDDENEKNFFDWQKIIFKYRFQLLFAILGLIFVGLGVFYAQKQGNANYKGIEVLKSTTESENGQIIAEVAGAVESPGVYRLENGARVEDILIAAGGISADADRVWMEKAMNRAAKISDGQKIYIPSINEQSTVYSAKNFGGDQTISSNFSDRGSGIVNINTASQKELESLNGIGPVYGQNIIEHRPYSNIEDLVKNGVIPQHVFEKIENNVSVF